MQTDTQLKKTRYKRIKGVWKENKTKKLNNQIVKCRRETDDSQNTLWFYCFPETGISFMKNQLEPFWMGIYIQLVVLQAKVYCKTIAIENWSAIVFGYNGNQVLGNGNCNWLQLSAYNDQNPNAIDNITDKCVNMFNSVWDLHILDILYILSKILNTDIFSFIFLNVE